MSMSTGLSPSSYEEAEARILAEYAQAAELCLPKGAWLRQVTGKFCDKIRRSALWRSVSKQYDEIAGEALELKPLKVLMQALELAEKKAEALEPLSSIDISVIGMLSNIHKNRQYLKLHRDKLKQEDKYKKNEDSRRENEDKRRASLHDAIMRFKYPEEEEGGFCDRLLLREMQLEDILDIIGIDEFIEKEAKLREMDREAQERAAERRLELEKQIAEHKRRLSYIEQAERAAEAEAELDEI